MNAASAMPRVVSLNEQTILASEAFLAELCDVAVQRGQGRDAAFEYAAKCLEELAVRPETRYLDRVTKLARFMITRSYEADLDVNTEQLDKLKTLARDHPMVFLWSHKSHLDSFAFLKAIYENDFRPQPLSFAGINMAFTGFGTLAKRSGAIFLRRSFRDDPIYKLVFRHYIDYLVAERVPLSWSIEGTRSRTGKLLPPKLGLIQWVVDSYHRASCDDVLLVPVSISFDQIAEMDDYVSMQRGLPKRKESLSWFIGYISGMKAKNGRIYLRFADPVSLSDAADVSEAIFAKDSSPQRIHVQRLAFEVSSRIEHATPITMTDLVTMVLLGANERALTVEQIRAHARPIVALVQKRALPTTRNLDPDTGDALPAALEAMTKTALLECYSETRQPVYRITPGKQLAAAYYRNTIVHYFLAGAIAELTLAASAGNGRSVEQFMESALRFRDLLKFEFFFRRKTDFCKDIDEYLDERYAGWRDALQGDAAETLFGRIAPLFGHSILRSFIEAYKVLAQLLLDKGGYEVSAGGEPQLFKDCLKVGQAMLLRKIIASETAVSEPLFATAAQLARYRGLLSGGANDIVARRQAFAAEINAAADAIDLLQRYYDQQQERT